MTDVSTQLVQAIDTAWADNQKSGHRYHLGASIIGKACARQVWYTFWWWHATRHTGRILRLFNRGHREEQHAADNLRRMGAQVELGDQYGNQVRFSKLWGLFGGERDGAISGLDAYGLNGTGLLEFKTHGSKSFKNLVNKGLISAKPEHHIQMQLYMSWSGFEWGIYYAVNKDTDELYLAVVHLRPEFADQYTERARSIVKSDLPPKRISEDASWFACKFCDYKRHCHGDEKGTLSVPDKNCRTCKHVNLTLMRDKEGVETHVWRCRRWNANPPEDVQREGCDQWEQRQIS